MSKFNGKIEYDVYCTKCGEKLNVEIIGGILKKVHPCIKCQRMAGVFFKVGTIDDPIQPIGNGIKITTLGDLYELAVSKRSVVCPASHAFSKPKPAGFIINLPGSVIFNLFLSGMFLYEKKGKR